MTTRNADALAGPLAALAALGHSVPSDARRGSRLTAGCCAFCGSDTSTAPTVWRIRDWRWGGCATAVCEACAKAERRRSGWRKPESCGGDCGRTVTDDYLVTRRYRRGRQTYMLHRVWCSYHCRRVLFQREADEARAAVLAERVLECPCGERIDAIRADARYCSPACRQRAYRARREPAA